MNKYLLFFGFSILIILLILIATTSETIVDGEQLCVDGNNNKNLEGIMCEDSYEKLLGMDGSVGFLILGAFTVLGTVILIIGSSGDEDDN